MRLLRCIIRPFDVEFWASWYDVSLLRIRLLWHGRHLFQNKSLHLSLLASMTAVCCVVSIVDLLDIARERRDELSWLSFILRLETTTCCVVHIVQGCHVGFEALRCFIQNIAILSGRPHSFSGAQAHCLLGLRHPIRVPRVIVLGHGYLPAETKGGLNHSVHILWDLIHYLAWRSVSSRRLLADYQLASCGLCRWTVEDITFNFWFLSWPSRSWTLSGRDWLEAYVRLWG